MKYRIKLFINKHKKEVYVVASVLLCVFVISISYFLFTKASFSDYKSYNFMNNKVGNFPNFVTDIGLDVYVDGEKGDVPKTGGYIETFTCSDSNTKYNSVFRTVEIASINGLSGCSLNYTTGTNNYDTLVDVVKNNTDEFSSINYVSTIKTLNDSDFLNVSQYSGSASNPTEVNLFTNNNGVISINGSDITKGVTYNYVFNVAEEGYYRFCFNYSGTIGPFYYDMLSFQYDNSYIDALNSGTIIGRTDYTYDECTKPFYATTDKKITIYRVVADYYNYVTQIGDVQATVEKVNVETISSGYRYTSKNANNYVYFNNDLYQIIGAIPTATSAKRETVEV